MQRDDYFAMIRYARDMHIRVPITTNASLLHLKDNYRKMIDADVNELQISVDGASKQVYEGIRRGANYERVMANIALINRYARERGVERTKMWTVVQQGNLHELEALVDHAAALGFRNQVFSLELTDFGLTRWHEINAAASVEQNLDIDYLLGLVERGKERGVRVRFWNTTAKYWSNSPEALCPLPFERVYIASDQRVVPCCFIGIPCCGDHYRSAKPASFARSGSEPIFKRSARRISTVIFPPIAAAAIVPGRNLPLHRADLGRSAAAARCARLSMIAKNLPRDLPRRIMLHQDAWAA